MTENERLEIITKYNEIKPLYDLAIQQVKNELLESTKQADTVDLPNGTQLLLKRKKGYEKKTVDTKRLKEEAPDTYNAFLKVSQIAESVSVEVLYPTETRTAITVAGTI